MKVPADRAKNFLIHADRDISAFDILKDDSRAHPETICFHAQQAVEKILKAALLSHDIDPTRTHDLAALTMAIQKIPLVLPLTIDTIIQLNPYAVQSRYDDTGIDYISSAHAEIIIKEMRKWVTKYI